MTPTLPLILFVTILWTLPASAAVIAYRRHDSSVTKLARSVRRALAPVASTARTEKARARADA